MKADVAEALDRCGLLLLQDATRPSLATIVAGEVVRGSWWSHPRSHAIFGAAGDVEDDPDVLVTKLVDGKVTFVHRRWWADVLGMATSEEPWQTDGLPEDVRRLVDAISEDGDVRSDRWTSELPADVRKPADVFRDVERRLLARVWDVHTERGAHAKVAERWSRWAAREQVVANPPGAAREALAGAVRDLGGGKLPWGRVR